MRSFHLRQPYPSRALLTLLCFGSLYLSIHLPSVYSQTSRPDPVKVKDSKVKDNNIQRHHQETILDLPFVNRSELTSPISHSGKPDIRAYVKGEQALFLDGSSYLKLPGHVESHKFHNGTRLTIEAWVAPLKIVNGQQVYIIGKGRTQNLKFATDNQNYALRLRGINGQAKISFLFRSVHPKTQEQQFNRWNSKLGFPADGSWHHIVIQYDFGRPENITAFVDGKKSAGSWDMGGPTSDPPVVDNDEIWIGSSMSGSPAATFAGWIKGLRIYRNRMDSKWVNDHARAKPKAFPIPKLNDAELNDGKVLIEIVEQVPEQTPPFLITTSSTEKFKTDYFALEGTPRKYARPGVIADRTGTFLVRGRIKKSFSPGEYEIRVRAKSASALIVGTKILGTLPMMKRNASGHEAVPQLLNYDNPKLYPPPAGHQEKTFKHTFRGGEEVIRFETLVGGKGLRNELGEVMIAIRKQGEEQFRILSNQSPTRHLLYSDWDLIAKSYRSLIAEIEKKHRLELAQLDQPFWNERHQKSELLAYKKMPGLKQTSIDQIVDRQLKSKQLTPTEQTTDEYFLRRIFLDTVGIPPTRNDVSTFLNDTEPDKRAAWIKKLLTRDDYADHWVSYWQDVLAENPGILKPKLNNTGPFRFWIHDSLIDNKPLDRFAAELIGMKGSRTGGGPAGFGQATQNDVPAAAKANVLSRAFLGIDLTCARCHDSPTNHFEQKDLFQMAAMLNRKPLTLPKTSTVPNAGAFSAVKVTLKPGQSVDPGWPFKNDLPFDPLTNTDDSRRRLAEMITSPDNDRFAQVMANRIWSRVMGQGLMDSADDFLLGKARNPELLDYLARYLQANQFDAKRLLQIILESKTYQRRSSEDEALTSALGARRTKRLTAEQVVDSLFAVSGKELSVGQISFDPEGRRTSDTFLNLGKPRRAWELTSLANERDRPALALPRAQSIVDILNAYGWRESRPNPLTDREAAATLVQPLVLANGNAAHRVVQLSDDSTFTKIALTADSVDSIAEETFQQILGRKPNQSEYQVVRELLNEGFSNRKVPGAGPSPVYSHQFRSAVSWSNHLHPDATQIKLKIEKAVRQGDFATSRLKPQWRERMEDLVWALVNSPEFILVQ